MMRRKQILAAAVLLLTGACTPLSPSGEYSELRGRIQSLYYNAPAAGAVVTIPERAIRVTANADGYFEITGLPTEAWQVRVEYGQHQPLQRQVRIEPFGAKYVEFFVDTAAPREMSVVFERDFDIWKSDLYGMQQQNVTGDLSRGLYRTSPSWSPDKKQIAFIAYDPTQRLSTSDGLWMMQADGTLVQKILAAPDIGRLNYLRWAASGSQFLFMLQDRMFVYRAEAGQTQNLSGVFVSDDSGPDWTPNGRHIVYSAYSLNSQTSQNMRQIFIMDGDGGHRTQLTSQGNNYGPAVSPDGKKLAYVSELSGFPEIWVMEINGQNPRQVTYLQSRRTSQPAWAADNRHILFNSDYMQQYPMLRAKDLWLIRADGEGLRQLSNDAIHPDG